MTKKNVNDMKNCKVVKAEILHCVQNDGETKFFAAAQKDRKS